MPDVALIVLSTFGSEDDAARIGRILVEEKLAACASLVPRVRSIYAWQGKICDDGETLAILKTSRDRYDQLARRLSELHPYEVPEIIALAPEAIHAPYLAWLVEQIRI